MGFVKWLKKLNLKPKQDVFFVLLADLAAQGKLCADALQNVLAGDPAATAILQQGRQRAKDLTAEITRELWRSYITPFDREDIQDFASDLYKIPKVLEKIAARLTLPGISDDRQDFMRQAAIIAEQAGAMRAMVAALSQNDNERVQAKITQMYDLEQKGDDTLGALLAELFAEHRDPRDLISRHDMYDLMEKAIDRYRDASAVILRIVLKHN